MRNYTLARRVGGIILMGMLLTLPALGQAAATQGSKLIRSDAPLKYTVKKGDTLWDLAGYFLKDPFLWPKIWDTNSDIANPHLIYPGQTLYLIWVNGRPLLSTRPPAGNLNKLEPRVHVTPKARAVPAIALDKIRAFLDGPRVVDLETLEQAPYVVGFEDGHLLGGLHVNFYAKNVDPTKGTVYNVVQLGKRYKDPETGEDIGQEVIPVATSHITRQDERNLVTMAPVVSEREIRKGDRLLPPTQIPPPSVFYPHPPGTDVQARIVSVFGGITQGGRWQIVTLNRGSKAGLDVGTVLDVYSAGRLVDDPHPEVRDVYSPGPRANCCNTGSAPKIQLPQEHAGRVMVFTVYPNLSYALIMESERAVRVADYLRKPRRSQ